MSFITLYINSGVYYDVVTGFHYLPESRGPLTVGTGRMYLTTVKATSIVSLCSF